MNSGDVGWLCLLAVSLGIVLFLRVKFPDPDRGRERVARILAVVLFLFLGCFIFR